MAFILEMITEADREFVNSFNFKSPFNNMPIVPKILTVDRDRDAFLVALGGQGGEYAEIPWIMVLIWEKNPIYIEAYYKYVTNQTAGSEISWKITKIQAPEILKNDNDMVLNLVTQAVEAGGFGRKIPETNFDYIAEPQYVREVM